MMRYSGRIFDGEHFHEKAEMEVNESTGEIEYLEETKNSDKNYDGLTFLPGLIDVHTHFFGTPTRSLMDWVLTSDVLLTLRSYQDSQKLLNGGFTTIRTLGDKVSLDMGKAEKIGMIRSPRIISAGFSLAETGGDDDPKMFTPEVARQLSYSYYCDGPWECRKAVRMNLRKGAEVIKAYASRSFVGGGLIKEEFTVEELSAIADEAHRAHIKATAHAYGKDAITNTIDANFDSVEHGLELTEDHVNKMVHKGMFYVPTMSVYKVKRADVNHYRDAMIKTHLEKDIQLAYSSGVKIAAGTDYVGSDDEPHGQNYLEAVYISEVVGPLDALKSITSVAADCVGRSDIGRLMKGKKADFIAVRGDPMQDVSLLRPENVVLVVKNGKVEKNTLNQ